MHGVLPVLGLLANALIWGLSWWPFRILHGAGLHPLWATALMYSLMAAGLIYLLLTIPLTHLVNFVDARLRRGRTPEDEEPLAEEMVR